jgi:hypothetical protein
MYCTPYLEHLFADESRNSTVCGVRRACTWRRVWWMPLHTIFFRFWWKQRRHAWTIAPIPNGCLCSDRARPAAQSTEPFAPLITGDLESRIWLGKDNARFSGTCGVGKFRRFSAGFQLLRSVHVSCGSMFVSRPAPSCRRHGRRFHGCITLLRVCVCKCAACRSGRRRRGIIRRLRSCVTSGTVVVASRSRSSTCIFLAILLMPAHWSMVPRRIRQVRLRGVERRSRLRIRASIH